MFDARKLLDQVMGQTGGIQEKIKANPGLSGLAAGTLAGLLLGSNKGTGLLKLGGAAALGGLAYKAYRDWQIQQGGAQAEPPKSPAPPDGSGNDRPLVLLGAVIAAAKADGHIDAEEHKRIVAHLETLNLDSDSKAWVMDELMKPLDIDAVARAANGPEEATQVYAASFLAIDPDKPEERQYLATLSRKLGLDPSLAERLESSVAAARGS